MISLLLFSFPFITRMIDSSPHCCRWIVFVILVVLSFVTTTWLLIVLYKDSMKEKALAEKKKGWIGKWEKIQPFVAKFPLGFLLGFIRNLIVLAIDRQADI